MRNSLPSPQEAATELARRRGLLSATESSTDLALKSLRADPANLFTAAGKAPDPWQAELLRKDRQQTLLLCSRQSGKSTTAAAIALKAALLNPGSLVLLLSPTQRQSGELFRDKVLRHYNDLGRPVATTQESRLEMELANGSRIISLPGDEKTIRGYSGVALLVIDEAARVEDDLYYAVRPMLAVSGGRLVCLSTPYGQRGWFYHEWHGEGPWERVKVTAIECPRIPPAFLEEERRSLGEEQYAQEYGCEFTAGGGLPLYPALWLDFAAKRARELQVARRVAKAIGVDPAEGGDKTAWAVVDDLGLIHLFSQATPDTSSIVGRTKALMREFNVPAERVLFDRGGGGKQIADFLRADGLPVRTIGFGEVVVLEPRQGMAQFVERLDTREEKYAFRFRRDQMYWQLRELLDPVNGKGFALPAEYKQLRDQLAPIPVRYDKEGRFSLPPKHKSREGETTQTLVDLIGHSPDEADALCLAVHALLHKAARAKAGVSY